MPINKIATFIIGMVIIGIDVVSIIKGVTYGVADSGYSKLIHADENPIYFWFSVILGLIFGILLIIAAFEKDIKK